MFSILIILLFSIPCAEARVVSRTNISSQPKANQAEKERADKSGSKVSGVLINDKTPINGALVFLSPLQEAKSNNKGKVVRIEIEKDGTTPEIVPLRKNDSLEILNRSDTGRFFLVSGISSISPNLPLAGRQKIHFGRGRTGPVGLQCAMQKDSSFFVYLCPTEHFVLSDSKGRFEMSGLPKGDYELRVWKADGGYLWRKNNRSHIKLKLNFEKKAEHELGELNLKTHRERSSSK